MHIFLGRSNATLKIDKSYDIIGKLYENQVKWNLQENKI